MTIQESRFPNIEGTRQLRQKTNRHGAGFEEDADANLGGLTFKQELKTHYLDIYWFLYVATDEQITKMGYSDEERERWIEMGERYDLYPDDDFESYKDMDDKVGEDARLYKAQEGITYTPDQS